MSLIDCSSCWTVTSFNNNDIFKVHDGLFPLSNLRFSVHETVEWSDQTDDHLKQMICDEI